MALSRSQRDAMRALCGEIHSDDGVDPREFFRVSDGRRHKNDYATLRLCARVQQTLELILPDALGGLEIAIRVESVMPAPNAARLLVTIAIEAPTSDESRRAIESRLAELTPWLRSEVAGAVSRRKAPGLAYALTLMDAGTSPEEESHA